MRFDHAKQILKCRIAALSCTSREPFHSNGLNSIGTIILLLLLLHCKVPREISTQLGNSTWQLRMAFHAQKKVNCKAMVLKLLWTVMSCWKCCLFLVSPLSDINSALKNWCCVIEVHESL